jgi:hypothetical protein
MAFARKEFPRTFGCSGEGGGGVVLEVAEIDFSLQDLSTGLLNDNQGLEK